MSTKRATDLIAEWMEDFGSQQGYELSRSEFVKEGSDWFLRVYVDKIKEGCYQPVSMEDCEAVSRFLGEKLDEADPIKQAYYLEVCSPGLDRLLVGEKDFQRFQGSLVDVKLYRGLKGKKKWQGTLLGVEDGVLKLQCQGEGEVSLPMDAVSRVQLAVLF